MFDLARSGDSATLVGYVDAGVPVDLTNPSGDTLLILAAYYDQPGTVAALLERHADVARVNDRGQTALAAAVIRRSDAVELLLAAGADPTHGSPSPIEVAEFFDLPDMLTLLRT
ncbi:MAG: ankyrin repeat domain-containing protein [Actinomycetota bacterium]|nr:ankyrin repeat domain-containing protein [Actinomycetota bacterium]